MSGEGTCRRCGADVRWVKSVNDKNLPLDPVPVDDPKRGQFALVDDVAHYVQAGKRAELLAQGLPLWESHFVSCSTLSRVVQLHDAAKAARELAEMLDALARNGSEP